MTRTSAPPRSSDTDIEKNELFPEKVMIATTDLYRAGLATSLGSALEYYDFALYSLASALIFGPLFFPTQGPAIGLIASFSTYFLGFAVRPVGGIIFGIIGDRLGRKFVLLATITLMGAASTLIGVLPTYDSVGYWAPIMLVALRLLQGLGAGAEQAGATVLMTEYAPRERRGFFAALPFMGIQLGTSSRVIRCASSIYWRSLGPGSISRYRRRVVKRYLLLAEGDSRSAERDSVSASIAAIEAKMEDHKENRADHQS